MLNSNKLIYRLIEDKFLDSYLKIKKDSKYNISFTSLNIYNSKFIAKPEDKFETMLFLPPNPQRIDEGGLRTKGLFKFSYKLVKNQWYICDLDGNPVIPAPEDIQKQIKNYVEIAKAENSSVKITELPLTTVITVVYNGAKHLEKTIQSVINQTYPNVEYIIIDGGSTDGTLDIIKKYEDYIDYWVSEPDKGIYDAMNKGTILANGQWLNYMNAGDIFFEEGILEQLIRYVIDPLNNESINLIYGRTIVINEKGEVIYGIGFSEEEALNKLRQFNSIGHQSVLFRSSLFKKFGLYDVKIDISADYEIYLRNYKNLNIKFVNKIVAKMIAGGVSDKHTAKRIFNSAIVRWRHRKTLEISLLYIISTSFYWFVRSKFAKLFKPITKRIWQKKYVEDTSDEDRSNK